MKELYETSKHNMKMEAASIFWGSVHIKVEILLYINWRTGTVHT